MTIVNDFMNIGLGSNLNPAVEHEANIEKMYRRKLFEVSVNRFKWIGLPDSIDPRFLETTLFYNGLAVFYFDDNYLKYLALRGTPSGNVDYQDNPTKFTVLGNQMISKTLNADTHCVPIWGNYSRMPDLDIVNLYARRLASLDRTIEINSDNARQTRVLVVDEDSRLAVENVNRQISEGTPTVRVTNALQPFIHALDMGIDPNMFDKISLARSRVWNECMTLLGINNANQDKRERLVASEVAANDEQIEVVKATNLAARQEACARINDRYGLSVSVAYDTDVTTQISTASPYDEVIDREFRELIGGAI